MPIISLVLLGLLVGLAGKLLMPGKDPGGFVVTILLGIAGAFVGAFIASYIPIAKGWFASLAMAIIGAMLLLLAYRLIRGTTASHS
ncbi:MAG TPA: GlsB/YeaQ/YmgE family stress response membrane protein [Pyrinomonadaceae bacterium]|nr:GlsB/YeaQ/YmgE family stress response membrane protein [Pyrinomonadaceae bacterium]